MNNKRKYFASDYWGMAEEEIPEGFPEAVRRLIEDLPESLKVYDVEFGVEAHYSRDPFEQEPYYVAWVSERGDQ